MNRIGRALEHLAANSTYGTLWIAVLLTAMLLFGFSIILDKRGWRRMSHVLYAFSYALAALALIVVALAEPFWEI
jgi:drug/metabolite transporter (DMT)-like permease